MSYTGIYRAKVLDNNDTSKFGRIKVEVYPFMVSKESAIALSLSTVEGIEISVLPWAVPAFSIFEGSGDGFGSFCVPKVGSYVFVFFENGDIYQPVYFAEAPDGVHGLPTERTTHYPDKKVLKTKNGFIIELDDTEDEQDLKITHPSGTSIEIESDGTVTINSVKDLQLTATGQIDIDATGNVNINGKEIHLNE